MIARRALLNSKNVVSRRWVGKGEILQSTCTWCLIGLYDRHLCFWDGFECNKVGVIVDGSFDIKDDLMGTLGLVENDFVSFVSRLRRFRVLIPRYR